MKIKRLILMTAFLILAVCLFSPLKSVILPDAGKADKPQTQSVKVDITFDADSAYAFTAAQCAFGSRAMNTEAHELCKEWIKNNFLSYGCELMTQEADLRGYDGTILKATNIIARLHPEAEKRVLLCAHWDSRPWADNDADESNWHKPIIAANDAASGVAVMLEIARLLSVKEQVNFGIDFVCFDAEDWGTPQWAPYTPGTSDTWALGAQYFAKNMPLVPTPQYGILLDMVGGENATFYIEDYSERYALSVVERIWKAARVTGYSNYFPKEKGGMITDDHVALNTVARIPTADIVPYMPNCLESSFGPTWHTMADDLDHISKNTLKAVGQTVLQALFEE